MNAASHTSILPFRIRIGVTGHRSLSNPQYIINSLRDILNIAIPTLFDVDIAYKNFITPFVFTVSSSLAEGADRLVAKEILLKPDSDLEVVLPMHKDEYRKHFEAENSELEFYSLYNRASEVKVFSKNVKWDELITEDIRREARRKAYEESGQYVVDHSDVLIAIWDGKPSRGRGGTAEIVQYARNKKCSLIIIPSDNPSAYTIERNRLLNSAAYSRLEYFNTYSLRDAVYAAYNKNEFEKKFDTPEGAKIPENAKKLIQETLIPFYTRSSFIAKQNKKEYFNAGTWTYILSPLAIAAVVLGILAPSLLLPTCFLELIILLAIYILIYTANKKKVHKKWIEERFLTERLRFAIISVACQVKPSPMSLSPLISSTLGSFEWVIRAFNEILRKIEVPSDKSQEKLNQYVDFIRIRLVREQITYHESNSRVRKLKSRRLEMIGLNVFLAALLMAGMHFYASLPGSEFIKNWIEYPVLFLVIVLPSIGAAIGGHRTHREYSRLAEMNNTMKLLLRVVDNNLNAVETWKDFEKIVHDIEEIMLRENQDWMNLMRFAKIDM